MFFVEEGEVDHSGAFRPSEPASSAFELEMEPKEGQEEEQPAEQD